MEFEQPNKLIRCNVYGDGFLLRLAEFLKEKSKIEVAHEMTVKRITVKRLYQKVSAYYKRMNRKRKYSNYSALIMVGNYDIARFSQNKPMIHVLTRMKKALFEFVDLMQQFHTHVVVFTAVPMLKHQGKSYCWDLMEKYNDHIRSLAVHPKVKIVDSCALLLKPTEGRVCNEELYEKERINSKKDVGVLWNTVGMERVMSETLIAGKDALKVIE